MGGGGARRAPLEARLGPQRVTSVHLHTLGKRPRRIVGRRIEPPVWMVIGVDREPPAADIRRKAGDCLVIPAAEGRAGVDALRTCGKAHEGMGG